MGSGQVSKVLHVRNLDITQTEDSNTQEPRFQASRWLAGISTQVSLSISQRESPHRFLLASLSLQISKPEVFLLPLQSQVSFQNKQ